MVGSCSAFGCKNRWNKHQKLLFHKFPLNDPERLQKWLKALRRESWQPTKHSFLCSLHFTADSYKSNPRHFLKDDAVPTLSCFSTDFPKIVRKKTIDIHPLPILPKQHPSVSQQKVIPSTVSQQKVIPSSVSQQILFLPQSVSQQIVILPQSVSQQKIITSSVSQQKVISPSVSQQKIIPLNVSQQKVFSQSVSQQGVIPPCVSQQKVTSKISSNSNPGISVNVERDTFHKQKESSNTNTSFEANELEIPNDSGCDGNYIVSDDEMNELSDIEISDALDTKKKLDIMTAHYKKLKKKFKISQQRLSLYKKEVATLKVAVNCLRQINSVSDGN